MSTTSDEMWVGAATDHEAQEHAQRLTAARVAAHEIIAALARVGSKSEHVHRKALYSDRLDTICATLVEGTDFAVLRSDLEASLDHDYDLIEKAANESGAYHVGLVKGDHSLEQVQQYLPRGYTATQVENGNIFIEGHDQAGWTWVDYVIPRLASGLIFVDDVSNEGQGITWASLTASATTCPECGSDRYIEGRKCPDCGHLGSEAARHTAAAREVEGSSLEDVATKVQADMTDGASPTLIVANVNGERRVIEVMPKAFGPRFSDMGTYDEFYGTTARKHGAGPEGFAGGSEINGLRVCDDCAMLIANAEPASDEHAAAYEEMWSGWHLALGDQVMDFSSLPCDGCGSPLAGARHNASAFKISRRLEGKVGAKTTCNKCGATLTWNGNEYEDGEGNVSCPKGAAHESSDAYNGAPKPANASKTAMPLDEGEEPLGPDDEIGWYLIENGKYWGPFSPSEKQDMDPQIKGEWQSHASKEAAWVEGGPSGFDTSTIGWRPTGSKCDVCGKDVAWSNSEQRYFHTEDMGVPDEHRDHEPTISEDKYKGASKQAGGPRYAGDPKWITVDYPGMCRKCKAQIPRDGRAWYWPSVKVNGLECESCGADSERRFLSEIGEFTGMRKGAPFAGYEDFDACVTANSDKDDPEAYCGKIKHEVEGSVADWARAMGIKSVIEPRTAEWQRGFDAGRLHALDQPEAWVNTKQAGQVGDPEQEGFIAGWQYQSTVVKEASDEIECQECGNLFKKKIGPNTFEIKCPKCGSYDTLPTAYFGRNGQRTAAYEEYMDLDPATLNTMWEAAKASGRMGEAWAIARVMEDRNSHHLLGAREAAASDYTSGPAQYYDDLGPGFTQNSFPQSEKREVARWSTKGGKFNLVLTHGEHGYDYALYDRQWTTPRSSGPVRDVTTDDDAIAEIEAQRAKGWHDPNLTRVAADALPQFQKKKPVEGAPPVEGEEPPVEEEKPEEEASSPPEGLDPATMQPGQEVGVHYTLTGEAMGEGDVVGTLESYDQATGKAIFNCETGRFAVTLGTGGNWVDAAGTQFSFSPQGEPTEEAPVPPGNPNDPAEQKPPPPEEDKAKKKPPFQSARHTAGWSCTREAGETMDALTRSCIAQTGRQNEFNLDDGRSVFWERGKEQPDGAITGGVFETSTGRRVGSFKIGADGSLSGLAALKSLVASRRPFVRESSLTKLVDAARQAVERHGYVNVDEDGNIVETKWGYTNEDGEPVDGSTEYATEGIVGDGMILDAQTANLVVQGYEIMTPEQRAKMDSLPVSKIVDVLWRAVGRSRTSSKRCDRCMGRGTVLSLKSGSRKCPECGGTGKTANVFSEGNPFLNDDVDSGGGMGGADDAVAGSPSDAAPAPTTRPVTTKPRQVPQGAPATPQMQQPDAGDMQQGFS